MTRKLEIKCVFERRLAEKHGAAPAELTNQARKALTVEDLSGRRSRPQLGRIWQGRLRQSSA